MEGGKNNESIKKKCKNKKNHISNLKRLKLQFIKNYNQDFELIRYKKDLENNKQNFDFRLIVCKENYKVATKIFIRCHFIYLSLF